METERLATLGSIAGLLVHDLRQPLMSQLANIEVLADLAQDGPTLVRVLERPINWMTRRASGSCTSRATSVRSRPISKKRRCICRS